MPPVMQVILSVSLSHGEREELGQPEVTEDEADGTDDDADLGHVLRLDQAGGGGDGVRRGGNREEHRDGGADGDEGNHGLGAADRKELAVVGSRRIGHAFRHHDEDRDEQGRRARL